MDVKAKNKGRLTLKRRGTDSGVEILGSIVLNSVYSYCNCFVKKSSFLSAQQDSPFSKIATNPFGVYLIRSLCLKMLTGVVVLY